MAGSHRRDVQGLRGVAVILVVLYHAGVPGFSGGFIGVDVFLVISGFVITASIDRELDASGRLDVGRFFARRVRRLFPALGAMIVVTLVVGALVLPVTTTVQEQTAGTALAATLFGANFFLSQAGDGYFAVADEANPLLHTWSLSLEEQFYVLFPFIVTGAWFVARRTALALVLGVGSAVSLLISSFASAGWQPEAFYLLPTRWWEFGVGALIAIAWPHVNELRSSIRHLSALAGGLLVAAATIRFDDETVFPGFIALVPVLGTGLIVIAAPRALAAGWLVWVGDRSYSWYLWHWPAIVFVGVFSHGRVAASVAAVAALGPAELSYRYVEERWRRSTAIDGWRAVRFAAVGIAIPATLAGIALIGADRYWGVETAQSAKELPFAFESCFNDAWSPDACTRRADPAGQRGSVFLVGDSHAASLSEGVAFAADQIGLDMQVWTHGSCPFMRGRSPEERVDCPAYQRDVFDLIERSNPSAVVIMHRSTQYTLAPGLDRDEIRTPNDLDGMYPGSTERAIEEWEAGLADSLSFLDQLGIPALVVHVGPEFDDQFEVERVSVLRPGLGDPVVDLDAVEARRGAAVAAERRAIAASQLATGFDPVTVLCTERCPAISAGELLFWDRSHLSIAGSRLVGEHLVQPLGALVESD